MQDSATTAALTNACQENPLPRGKEALSRSVPCFELFRRAVVQECQAAWSAVFQIYHQHMLRWARSSGMCAPHEPEDIAQQAWIKFIRAAPATFEGFTDLFVILRYLKLCVKSVFVDQIRKAKSDEKAKTFLERKRIQASSPEKTVLERILSEQFAQEVYAQLDEQEALVFRLTFELGLAPRQIAQQYADIFPDVRAVHRVKERAFRRLRSNPMLRFLYDNL